MMQASETETHDDHAADKNGERGFLVKGEKKEADKGRNNDSYHSNGCALSISQITDKTKQKSTKEVAHTEGRSDIRSLRRRII